MPKPAITRVSSMVVDSSYNDTNQNNGFYAPQLTTAQIAAILASTLQNGAIVYNTTTNTFQVYQNGGWTNLTTGATNALVAPNLTTANRPAVPANGMIYYDTTTNEFSAYLNGAWVVLYPTTNLAGNLIVPVVANTGALPAVPANGMIVYQTDIGAFKVYQTNATGAGWAIMYNNVSTATGAGLAAGDNPFTLPDAARVGVEVVGNQVNGFVYYDSTNNLLRGRVNANWGTLQTNIANLNVGSATLAAGTVTVNTIYVTANSNIFLQTQGTIGAGNSGNVRVSAVVPGTSFTITSTDNADTSAVRWFIVNS